MKAMNREFCRLPFNMFRIRANIRGNHLKSFLLSPKKKKRPRSSPVDWEINETFISTLIEFNSFIYPSYE